MGSATRRRSGDLGQTTIEYGLVLAFFSILLIASLLLLRAGLDGYYAGLRASIEAVI